VALHADALGVLEAWDPGPGRQRDLRDGFVAHLRARPDAMTRGCFPDHLTAGVLVVSEDLDRVLLNLHGKARRWFAFGGHSEPSDQTLAGVALREAVEESGVSNLQLNPLPVHLDQHAVAFCDPRGTVHHLDVRVAAQAPGGAVPSASDESMAVRWWPVDDLPDLEEEMHALIDAARARFAQAQSASPSPSPGGGSSWAAADQPDRYPLARSARG